MHSAQAAYLEVQAGGRIVGVVLLQLDGRLGVDGGHAGRVLHPVQRDGPPQLHRALHRISPSMSLCPGMADLQAGADAGLGSHLLQLRKAGHGPYDMSMHADAPG